MKKKNIDKKIFFIDLDFSFASSYNLNYTHPYNLLIAKKLIINGHIICFSTGRQLLGAKPFLDALGIKGPSITSGGSLVCDHKGKEIKNFHGKFSKFKEVVDKHFDPNRNIQYWISAPVAIHYRNENNLKLGGLSFPKTINILPFDNLKSDTEISNILLLTDPVDRKEIVEKIQSWDDGYATANYWITRRGIIVDIAGINANKANAAKIVLKKYNIDLKNAIAFGDSWNDFKMLKLIPNSFAPINADIKIRKIVKHVLPVDNDEPCLHEIVKILEKEGVKLFDE